MMPVSLAAGSMRAVAAGDAAQLALIASLQAEVEALREALGLKDAALYPRRLSPTQRAMFGMLIRRASVSRSQFMLAIYAARTGADLPNDPDVVFKVQLSHLRRRLRPDGIAIETINGRTAMNAEAHFRLAAEMKAKVRAIMAAEGEIGAAA